MDHPVFCGGPLLHAVEMSGIFTDSKTFVDRPLLVSPEEALEQFSTLGTWPNINQKDLRDWVDRCFGEVGSDLETVVPSDFKTVDQGGLSIARNIKDDQLRRFAENIHNKWKDLGRQVHPDVEKNPNRHTIIPVPYPFIVPGGRFREVYYWDSFWTIQGLLVSGMTATAKGMLFNFAHLIDKYGLIPNGNRIYYTKRSEPPLFALMVDHYVCHPSVEKKHVDEVVAKIVPALVKEYQFWMTQRTVQVEINGKMHTVNRYTGGDLKVPRPESYWEDYHDGVTLETSQLQTAEQFYGNIAAAAESGLDFSTRWLEAVGEDFLTMRTETIVPVDLNAFLCANENILADLYQRAGNKAEADRYRQLAMDRADTIHAVFWNEEKSMWRDYDLKMKSQREAFYLSNLVPLYTRCDGHTVKVTSSQFMHKLLQSPDLQKVISFPGGYPASFTQSTGRHCQWDFPNAWPPMQLVLIEGFHANADFRETALQWAQKWITVVYVGYVSSANVYEKYDARVLGKYGSGGEYLVQEGFGWTNGGILRLLELFGGELHAPSEEEVAGLIAAHEAEKSAPPPPLSPLPPATHLPHTQSLQEMCEKITSIVQNEIIPPHNDNPQT